MNEWELHLLWCVLEDVQVGDYATAEERLKHLIGLATTNLGEDDE